MTALRVIGVDPGPVPGVVVLHFRDGRLDDVAAYQCLAPGCAELVRWLLIESTTTPRDPALVQVETFVSRRRASRSSTPHAGAVARDLVGQVERAVTWPSPALGPVQFHQRSAAAVKPWATDARLNAVRVQGGNLLDLVGSVGRHARDAARHALYCAVKDGGLPDPLSRLSVKPA